ncbi:MAG: hypothetical protein ABI395_10495 [Sphingobium sp.]
MFGLDSGEFLVIVIVAVVVIGPKDLPRVLYKVGQVVGKARAMSRHFRSGIDTMVREVEMEELEKKWAADNKRIMAEHPDAGLSDIVDEEPVAPPVTPISPPAPSTP